MAISEAAQLIYKGIFMMEFLPEVLRCLFQGRLSGLWLFFLLAKEETFQNLEILLFMRVRTFAHITCLTVKLFIIVTTPVITACSNGRC